MGIGSAVLGGAGKSPVAIAVARAIAAGSGGGVALVCHAYRSAPGRARVVLPDDAPEVVGDDALAAARLLAADPVRVVVAPTRQAAVDAAAAAGARTIVVDGLLQSAPRRLAESVLVMDAEAPWGAGACPPLGDLRAAPLALLAASDRVAVVRDRLGGEGAPLPAGAIVIESDLAGAVDDRGARRAFADLAGLRVGLVLAIGRPDRVVRALARRGVTPTAVVALADHARLGPRALDRIARDADVWLTTSRCATKLPRSVHGRPVLALDHRLDPGALVRAITPRDVAAR